jgi:hypothetical protein
MIFVAVMPVAMGLHAQALQPTYVGLFADMERSIASVSGPGEFSLYVWWLPGGGGLDEVRYSLIVPGNLEGIRMVLNPVFYQWCEETHCLLGICATSYVCQSEWVWSHRIDYRLLDSAPELIEIEPCRGEHEFTTGTCDTAYVLQQPVVILNSFGLNQPEVIATDQATWGAIKNLYR